MVILHFKKINILIIKKINEMKNFTNHLTKVLLIIIVLCSIFTANVSSQGLSLSSVQTEVHCPGLSDGIVTLTVGSGSAPYTYLWSNAATTQNNNAIPAGIYSVTVTDNNGVIDSLSATITQPSTITATVNVIQNVLCY